MSHQVLVASNAPQAPSGYGVQASILGRGLAARGFDVSFAANSAIGYVVTEHHGLPVWPYIQMGKNAGGKSLLFQLQRHIEHYGPAEVLDVVVIYDVFMFEQDIDILRSMSEMEGLRLWWWCPIKRWPLFAADQRVLQGVPRSKVVPYGKWAKDRLLENGRHWPERMIQDPIPHAVMDAYLEPPRLEGLAEARKMMGADKDQTLVTMVAANASGKGSQRKSFAEAFRAFQHLRELQPGRWHLYIHSDVAGHKGGDQLTEVMKFVGLTGDVTWPDLGVFMSGLPTETMRDIYCASDQLWMPSRAEGFGVPIIEAMACGTPTLTTGVGVSGELVLADHWIRYVDAWEPGMRCWEAQPDWRHLAMVAQRVGKKYRSVGRGERLRRRAAAEFSETVVCDAWAERLRA